jgi:hypothetical protein
MTTMHDDEMRRAERARHAKFRWMLALSGLGATAAGAGFALGQGRTGDDATLAGVLAGVGVAFVIGGAILAWKTRPGDTRWKAEQGQGRRDRLQGQRARQLAIIPALSLIFLAQAIGAGEAVLNGEGRTIDYLRLAIPVLYAWLTPLIVMGWDGGSRQNRKWLEDELTQALRVRAIVAAFFVLMAGGTLALGLGLWRAEVGVVALPFVLAVAGATAGIRFAWLYREAGRDDG